MNRAYYFILVFTHFLFEAYKQDVTAKVIPVTVYPSTFRRMLVDFAVKICSHARHTVMKVTNTIYQTINFEEIWKLCQSVAAQDTICLKKTNMPQKLTNPLLGKGKACPDSKKMMKNLTFL